MTQTQKTSELDLPYNWRLVTSEMLNAKDIKLSPQQVYDVKRGKITDENLTNEVFKILRQISRKNMAKKTRLAKIRKGA